MQVEPQEQTNNYATGHQNDRPTISSKKLSIIRWSFLGFIVVFNLFYKGSDQGTQLMLAEVQNHTGFTLTQLAVANNIQTVSAIILLGPLGAVMDRDGVGIPLSGAVFAKMVAFLIQMLNNNFFKKLWLLYLAAPIEGPINGILSVAFYKLLLRWYNGKNFSIALLIDGISLGVGMIFGGFSVSLIFKHSGNSLLATNIFQEILFALSLLMCLLIARFDSVYGHYFDKNEADKEARIKSWQKNLKLPTVVFILCVSSILIDSAENTIIQNQSYFLDKKFNFTKEQMASVRGATVILEGVFSLVALIIITKYGHQSDFYLFNVAILTGGAYWLALLKPNVHWLLASVPLYFIQMGSAVKTLSFKTMIPNVVDSNVIGTIFGTTGSVQAAFQSFILTDGFSFLHDKIDGSEGYKYFWPLMYVAIFSSVGLVMVVFCKIVNWLKKCGLDKPLKKEEEEKVVSAIVDASILTDDKSKYTLIRYS